MRSSALVGGLRDQTRWSYTDGTRRVLDCMVDQGVEPYLVASSLVLVIAQRLVRTICQSCKVSVPLNDEWRAKLRRLAMDPAQLNGEIVYGMGCDECYQSGYSGRTAIYEFLPVDEVLRTQIMDGVTASVMKRTAVERGMITLRMDGCEKIVQRMSTPDEVLRVTQMG